MANEYRVSTFAAEVLNNGAPNARVSTFAAEVLNGGAPEARVSLFAVEVLRSIADAPAPTGLGRRMSLM